MSNNFQNFLLLDVPCYRLDDLAKTANELLKFAQAPAVIGFSGCLGAGKTELIREMLRMLGVEEGVSSPSYVLENIYRPTATPQYGIAGLRRISHWDFYRIAGQDLPGEIEEYGSDGATLVLIEWPELIPSAADLLSLHVHIAIDPGSSADRSLKLYKGFQGIQAAQD